MPVAAVSVAKTRVAAMGCNTPIANPVVGKAMVCPSTVMILIVPATVSERYREGLARSTVSLGVADSMFRAE